MVDQGVDEPPKMTPAELVEVLVHGLTDGAPWVSNCLGGEAWAARVQHHLCLTLKHAYEEQINL